MQLRTTIMACTQTLVDHVEELTALDAAIGDGDHGLNMKRGALAIQAKLPELETQSLNEALKTMGMTCMSTIGGSSGPVFGTLLVTLGKELSPQPGSPDMARSLAAAMAALSKLGKVEVGQKTLLDVLDPVQKVLARGGDDLVMADEEGHSGLALDADESQGLGDAHILERQHPDATRCRGLRRGGGGVDSRCS